MEQRPPSSARWIKRAMVYEQIEGLDVPSLARKGVSMDRLAAAVGSNQKTLKQYLAVLGVPHFSKQAIRQATAARLDAARQRRKAATARCTP